MIRENIEAIQAVVEKACQKAGRNPQDIKIVAVAKTFGVERIREAVEAGIRDIGENYLKETIPKQDAMKDLPIAWHFIGHLQRNKARATVERFSWIHGVDSLRLAQELQTISESLQKKIRILLQFKCHPNAAHGFTESELEEAMTPLLRCQGLEIGGLMTMAPPVEAPEQSRLFFRKTKEIFTRLKKYFPISFRELSMGMSGDYAVAVEEGATIIRIGRAIFGERPAIG